MPVGQIWIGADTQGLGLGLTLVQRIAQRLGGQLSLYSQPGQGTALRFELRRA